MTPTLPRTRPQTGHARRVQPGSRFAGAGLASPLALSAFGVLGVVMLPMLVLTVRGLAHASGAEVVKAALNPARIGTTAAVAAGVSLAACALGWLLARVAVFGGAWRRTVLALPLLMPPYLAYAGWSQARAPGTALGNAIERLASEGHAWVSVWTSAGLALAGVAVWASPLVAVVVAPAAARSERAFGAALRLDAGRLRAEWCMVCAHAGDLLRAWLLVAVVVAGSAVPLHLAQVETVSIGTWRDLIDHGPDEWWRGVVRVWPVLIAAGVAGAALARSAWRFESWGESEGGGGGRGARPAWAVRIAAWGGWSLATLVPVALFAANLGPSVGGAMAVVARWWARGWHDVRDSFIVAGIVAGVGLALACAGSLAASAPRARGAARGMVACSVAVWAVAALTPGVLVGVAMVASPVDGLWGLVCAHAARFGAVAVIAGLAAAGAEPGALRDLRALDGAGGVRGWLGACLPVQWAALSAGALVTGVLSLHEIESAVILRPVGWGSLPIQLLEHLHFFRTRELASAVLVVVGGSLVLSVVVAWLGSLAAGRWATARRAGL